MAWPNYTYLMLIYLKLRVLNTKFVCLLLNIFISTSFLEMQLTSSLFVAIPVASTLLLVLLVSHLAQYQEDDADHLLDNIEYEDDNTERHRGRQPNGYHYKRADATNNHH